MDKVKEYFNNHVSNNNYPVHSDGEGGFDLTTEHWKEQALRSMRSSVRSIEKSDSSNFVVGHSLHNNNLTKEALDMYALCLERDRVNCY